MKLKMYIISLVALFFLILGFQYNVEYGIRSQPPSDKWSKEVNISKGDVSIFPKVLENDKNNIVAFNDGDKVRLVVTDKLGKKFKEKTFETNSEVIKEINLIKAKEFFYLSFSSSDKSVTYLKTIKLDSELNELGQTKIDNITDTYQIGEDILIIGYTDKVEVLDIAKNSKLDLPIKGATLFSGVKTESGFIFTYCSGDEGFSYITMENGVASLPKVAGVLNKSTSMDYISTATSSDGKDGYLLIEYSIKGEFTGTRILKFALDESSKDSSDLYINDDKHVFNVIGTYSKEGARFVATTNRILGTKENQQGIVDFILKDNKVSSFSYGSRLAGLTTFPAISGDVMAYCSYSGPKEFGVYLASQNEQFKKANNVPLAIESKQARLNTLQGFMYSLIYIIYPIKWIVPVAMLISIMAFFSYAFSEKKKKLYFILISIISFALKLSVVLDNSYGENLYLLPQILAYKWVAIVICAVISALCYSFGYSLYKKDLDGMAIGQFGIALALDTILTMMIFVPFFVTLY